MDLAIEHWRKWREMFLQLVRVVIPHISPGVLVLLSIITGTTGGVEPEILGKSIGGSVERGLGWTRSSERVGMAKLVPWEA